MDFKEIVRITIYSVISIFLLLLLSLAARWIGIETEFFITLCLLGIVGTTYGIIKFTWGVARRKGIEYIWYVIFSLILLYGDVIFAFQIYELLFLNIPWVISLLIAFSPIILMAVAYFIYKITADDVVQTGVFLFLLSLFAGETAAIQIDKPIAREIAGNSPKIELFVDDVLQKTPFLSDGDNYMREVFPKVARTTTEIGKKGEHVTTRLLTSQGYVKVDSKITGNQGIDHIFVKYSKTGEISKIQIVETKVNTSQLRTDQMTDKGILDRIDKLSSKQGIGDKEKEVYEFIKVNIEDNRVVKQLYNHNSQNGVTTISKLGKNQEVIQTSSFENYLIYKVFK